MRRLVEIGLADPRGAHAISGLTHLIILPWLFAHFAQVPA
jgi:hypothetical protein